MKQETYILLWLLGLACLGVLLHQLGEPEVWHHVVMMGWGYIPVIGITLVAYANNVWVWRRCFDGGAKRPGLRPLLWVKLVGEALGNVMPASQIGKEVAKVMMLRERMGVTAGVSSLVLNKTGEMVSGVIFVLGGVIAGLNRYAFSEEIRWTLFAMLTLAVAGVVLTVVRQCRNPFTRARESVDSDADHVCGKAPRPGGRNRSEPGRVLPAEPMEAGGPAGTASADVGPRNAGDLRDSPGAG